MSISRVSSYQMSQAFSSQISKTQEKYNQLAQQIQSGVKVSSMTDDAVAAKGIVKANNELSNISLYESNIKYADNTLSETDSTLTSVNDQLQKAYDIAMQASNGTIGAEELKSYQQEIDAIIDNVTKLANTKYGDQYLFAGTKTTTAPYSLNESDDPADDKAGMVYQGDTGSRYAIVGEGKTEAYNFTGNNVFGGASFTTDADGNITVDQAKSSGAFGALFSIKEALQDTANVDDAELKSSMGTLKTSMDNVTATKTKVGALGANFDDMLTSYGTDTLNIKELKSNLEDTDLTSAISDWYSAYQSLQGSYSMMSKSMNVSLLNFI